MEACSYPDQQIVMSIRMLNEQTDGMRILARLDGRLIFSSGVFYEDTEVARVEYVPSVISKFLIICQRDP